MFRQVAAAAVTAGMVLTAAPGVLPMKAAAQQVAANTTGAPPPGRSACDAKHETDPKGAIACRLEELKARGAAAEQQIKEAQAERVKAQAERADAQAERAEAQARTACANEIGELRRNETYGAQATQIARDLVKASGRPAVENDPCVLRDGMRAGLTRLKLLPQRVSLQ